MEAIDKLRDLSKKLEDPYFIKEFEEGFEKFLKERDVKIYHVETQQDYDVLMSELEDKGITWSGGSKPTSINNWQRTRTNTCISLNNRVIEYCDTSYYKHNYPFIEIIEYKAKGDKQMLNPECKHCHKKWHQDSAKYCSWCGNKLVDEPEFKVGDIVSIEILPDGIGIVRLEEDLTNELSEIYGTWYTNNDCEIQEVDFVVFKADTRHATPEEVVEYETALTFHKHGRKPFEVKNGDVLSDSESEKLFFNYEDIEMELWDKEDFVSGDFAFLKTAEEVNEWLKGE